MRSEVLAPRVDMFTALVAPSSPFSLKANKWFVMHSEICQKLILRIATPSICTKFYPVPSQRSSATCYCTGRSLELRKNDLSIGTSDAINPQRGKPLVDNEGASMQDANDFERQVQELFNEVRSMVAEGQKDCATDLLQANYLAVVDQMNAGLRGIEQAAVLDVIALGYMGLGDFDAVEPLLNMLQEIVKSLGDDEALLDSVLMHMGSMFTTLGKYEDAKLVYERGLQILQVLFGKDSPFLITPLMGIAKVFGLTGGTSKAKEMYLWAINILETKRGMESEDLVLPLFGLGNLFLNEGQAADAENSFKRILNIYTNLYGENDGRVGSAMCSLAHASCAKGDINQAISLYRRGLLVIKGSKYMAIDDAILEKMRIDLAELLHVAGREKEGRALLEECLLISEMHKGHEHPSLVTHLLNLASSYSRSKNFVEAERLLRRSLQIMSKTVETDDQSITVPMLHLAVTLYHLKRDEEAESLALEVVSRREKAFGKQSLPVGEALDCLVSIQTRLGKDDNELLDHLKRVLKIQEKMMGGESEETVTTLKKIVFLLDKLGRKEEKLPLQRRLSALRAKYKWKIRV